MTMEIDVALGDVSLDRAAELGRSAEDLGARGLWVFEQTHNPYSLLPQVASSTSEAKIGTAISVAFPRSPMVVAYSAWDLQSFSNGRLMLGLGTQVKGHILRRFSMEWGSPSERLKDYVQCLRSIWTSWANEEPVDYDGEYYQIDLCPPLFTPDPIEDPDIDVLIGGVNEANLQLSGELCDGLCLHPANSPKYIEEIALPNIRRGAEKSGRDLDDFTLAASCLAVVGDNEKEIAKRREEVRHILALWGSTRTYRKIYEVHGWGDICEPLHEYSMNNEWKKMNDLITDEMVDELSVQGTWDEIRQELHDRYEHVDRVSLFTEYRGEDHWKQFFN